jgi:putative aldouronate transport system substrate-binding protein
MNALVAAGTAPDLLWEYGKDWMESLYNQAVIQPVGDLIDKYSTSYKAYLQSHPELLPYITGDDGQIWSFSNHTPEIELLDTGFWIRQDWLDKFGIAAPKTVDEFVAYCKRVRDDDPDGNGVKDTYGFVFNYTYRNNIRALFGQGWHNFNVVNGHYVDWTATPQYKEYLEWMAMMYREGYVDPEYVTDQQSQRYRQLVTTGKAGSYLTSVNTITEFVELKQNVPAANFVYLEPFSTSSGKFLFPYGSQGRFSVCLNKDSKNGEAVIKFIDWMITDGWWPLNFGTEGRHYRLVNGIPQDIDAALNSLERGYAGEMTLVRDYNPTTDWIVGRGAQDAATQEYLKKQAEYVKAHSNKLNQRFIPYDPNSASISRYSSEVSAREETLEVQIITGSLTADAGIQQLTALKNAAGWTAIQAEKDAWYQKNRTMFEAARSNLK